MLHVSRKCFPSTLILGCRTLARKMSGKKTCLYDFHVEKGAKIVDFAGFQMPLLYADQTVSASHNHTRSKVSIFDVSHMLQTIVSGRDTIKFIESLTVSDIQGMGQNQSTLSLLVNDKGGIIDDLVITKVNDECLYIVSNAGCIDKDLRHIQTRLEDFKRKSGNVEVQVLSDRALLAIQGPSTATVFQSFVDCDLSELMFMTSTETSICGVGNCRVTRCGYTGEDGVEISIPSSKARYILENLLMSKTDNVKLAGLAVRDSLRLEAGLCLYGNDITEDTTPVEAGLAWTIGKRRRAAADFPGADVILKQLQEKPTRRRAGFVSVGPPSRANTPIMEESGNAIGYITSGMPSPYLKKNIAMGYVPTKCAKVGTKVKLEIRKKLVDAEVVKMPFVPSRYYNKKS